MRESRLFPALLIAWSVYAAIFISRTTCVVEGQKYFPLLDDAMISMRYARNLSEGHGLVWNPGGECVEGFTNPLWVFWMAALHLLPLSLPAIGLAVQASGALFLLLTLIQVRRLAMAISGGSAFAGLVAAGLTAFCYPLVNWSLRGSEVAPAVFLVTFAAREAAESIRSNRWSWRLPACIFLAPWIRLDLAVTTAPLLAVAALWGGKRGARTAALCAIALVASIGAQTAWRMSYYEELLPNTYYLKLAGYPIVPRIQRGLEVTKQALFDINPAVVAGAMAFPFLAPCRAAWGPALAIAAQLAYNVYVGGDAWEWWGMANRYFSIVLPLLFALLAGSLAVLRMRLAARPALEHSAGRVTWLLAAAALFATGSGREPLAGFSAWSLAEPPPEHAAHCGNIAMSKVLTRITKPGATIAVAWAGTIPYHAERKFVDILGKNDRVVAHMKMRNQPFYPGHMKWDYAYSIGRLLPDVVAQLWESPEEAEPWLRQSYIRAIVNGFEFYLKRGSAEIRWDRVRELCAQPSAISFDKAYTARGKPIQPRNCICTLLPHPAESPPRLKQYDLAVESLKTPGP